MSGHTRMQYDDLFLGGRFPLHGANCPCGARHAPLRNPFQCHSCAKTLISKCSCKLQVREPQPATQGHCMLRASVVTRTSARIRTGTEHPVRCTVLSMLRCPQYNGHGRVNGSKGRSSCITTDTRHQLRWLTLDIETRAAMIVGGPEGRCPYHSGFARYRLRWDVPAMAHGARGSTGPSYAPAFVPFHLAYRFAVITHPGIRVLCSAAQLPMPPCVRRHPWSSGPPPFWDAFAFGPRFSA